MSKILVVEDDPMSLFMMEEMLSELGVDFISAKDGAEAVSCMYEHGSDLSVVLMDIHMPKVSGDEAVRLIRAADKNPPRDLQILAMTADNQWHNSAKLYAAGFSGALPKPINLDQLRRAIA